MAIRVEEHAPFPIHLHPTLLFVPESVTATCLARDRWLFRFVPNPRTQRVLIFSPCVCRFHHPGTPSITPSDPCRSSSWGNVLNPCGKFTCSTDKVDSTTNTCDCKSPFVLVSNTDGSRTCVHSELNSLSSMVGVKRNQEWQRSHTDYSHS